MRNGVNWLTWIDADTSLHTTTNVNSGHRQQNNDLKREKINLKRYYHVRNTLRFYFYDLSVCCKILNEMANFARQVSCTESWRKMFGSLLGEWLYKGRQSSTFWKTIQSAIIITLVKCKTEWLKYLTWTQKGKIIRPTILHTNSNSISGPLLEMSEWWW